MGLEQPLWRLRSRGGRMRGIEQIRARLQIVKQPGAGEQNQRQDGQRNDVLARAASLFAVVHWFAKPVNDEDNR
jgi:hypothetical protein